MKKKKKRYKAVFRTRIDFRYSESFSEPLQPGHSYYFEENSNFSVSYDNIVNEAVRIINSELRSEIRKYIDIPIEEIEVQDIYEGSIEILFSVVLGVLDFVGGVQDLYDTVNLIKEISSRYINKRLNDKFGKHFDVDAYVLLPQNHFQRFERCEMLPSQEIIGKSVDRMDAFFRYLLVANIVLLTIIGALVLGAVKTVYFL